MVIQVTTDFMQIRYLLLIPQTLHLLLVIRHTFHYLIHCTKRLVPANSIYKTIFKILTMKVLVTGLQQQIMAQMLLVISTWVSPVATILMMAFTYRMMVICTLLVTQVKGLVTYGLVRLKRIHRIKQLVH